MKAKIFKKLKQEYSALGLGDEYLMLHAQSLADMGIVTDDNVDAVVAVQRAALEAVQARTDKRVADALAKERQKFDDERKKAETEAREREESEKKAKEEAEKIAAEEAKRKAEEKAETKRQQEEAKRKAEEDAQQKSELEKLKEHGVSDAVIAYIQTLKEKADSDLKAAADANKKRETDYDAQLKSLVESSASQFEQYKTMMAEMTANHNALKADYDALKAENESVKQQKAVAARRQFIEDEARKLGIPQYRIDEGFVIADDATEQAIAETLGKVASNMRTAMLPGSNSLNLPGNADKPTDATIADFAKAIVTNI